MTARRTIVFCPAMFLLFILISFTTRKESFCQSDEISSKGITNGVNESFTFSSMFVGNQKRYTLQQKEFFMFTTLGMQRYLTKSRSSTQSILREIY